MTGCLALAGDTLQATCNFNSLEREEVTSAGATHHDEMCNLYMMMWSELPVFMTCSGGGPFHNLPYVNIHGPGQGPAHKPDPCLGKHAPQQAERLLTASQGCA